LIGGIIGPVGAYLRNNSEETPAFREVHERAAVPKTDAKTAFFLTARGFGFTVMWTVAYYIFLVFMPSLTKTAGKLTSSEALWSNTLGLLALVICAPLMGRLSDRIGRKPVLLTGCILFFVLTYPAFSVIASGVSLSTIMLVQFGLGVMLGHLRGVADRNLGDLSDPQPHYLDVDRLYLVGDDLRWFRAVHRGLAREGDRLVDGAVLLRDGSGCDQLHCHRPHAGNRTSPARLNGAAALKRASRPIR